MLSFIKKHWKGLLIGLGVILSFIGGLLARGRGPNIPGVSGNSGKTPGLEATDQINSQRLAGNIGKAIGQADGIADDNRRASDENKQLGNDIKGLAGLADRLDNLASGGGK